MVKSMVENSPKAVIDRTPARKFRISGTEKAAFSSNPRPALADVDEAVLLAVGERPQEDAPHDAENRRVRTDPERQRQDQHDREPLDLGQGIAAPRKRR
jgi:hypothetical protein